MDLRHRMKNYIVMTALVGVILLTLLPETTIARPSGIVIRHKRVSDQRLAELETLLALANMKGRLVTVPVGFGRVDPAKIGRKRRSTETIMLQKLHVPTNMDFSEVNNDMPIETWLQLEDGSEEDSRLF